MFAAFLAAASTGLAVAAEIKPWPGRPTPPLALPDLSGRKVELGEMRGRVVLVNFWATWCEPCVEEMPSLQRLRAKLGGKPFDVLTVNYGEGTARIANFLQKNRISLPVLLDPDKEAATAWGARGLPMTFLVGADGRVRYSAFGEFDWSDGEPLRVVESLLAEVPHAR